LGDIAGKLSVEIPEPLLQLASIRDLNLYVIFRPKSARSGDQRGRFSGRAETRELSFNPSEAGDLPTRARCAAGFSPFGRISVLPSMLLPEEDELEWVTACRFPKSVQSGSSMNWGHHRYFSAADFLDWLARFILAHSQE